MNRFLFIMLLLPGGSLMSQIETTPSESFNKRPLHRLSNPRIAKVDTTGHHIQLLKRYNAGAWLARGKKLYTTSEGTVYQLPIDNMACLVPDKRKVIAMPVKPMPGSRMPNGFRVQPVPKEKK